MKNTIKDSFSNEKEFLEYEFKSKARVLDDKIVEVIALDGEVYSIFAPIGRYSFEETRNYQLHLIEYIFDKNFSDDKELMSRRIWKDLMLNGINFIGMTQGDKQGERIRIGARIRQIREEKEIDAKDLARLANIDAANLSRIEKGKYSVGLDILSKLASALGYHIDIVPKQL